jgi:ABC-2 type transport system ATP-binding protein
MHPVNVAEAPAQPAAETSAIARMPSIQANAPVIEAKALTKRFGSLVALQNLDLSIPPGAIGLLGPNGAGKSTLIRLLLGLTSPTSGSASVLGQDIVRQGIGIRESTGYMPEGDCLPGNATAADLVGHMAEMSGLPKVRARQRAADVLYQVGLDEERYRLIRGFSTGMKQRVKLAQAIVHDPALVFLDEPTAGMDPPGRDTMLSLVDRIHREMGMTVVLSSHILEDIERVCNYVVIIDNGRLMTSRRIGGDDEVQKELVIRLDGNAQAFADRLQELGIADARVISTGIESPIGELLIRHDDERVYDAVRDVAVEMDTPLRTMRGRAHSLEELYLDSLVSGDTALLQEGEANAAR